MSTLRDLLRANDLRFVVFSRGLSDTEWSQPSLCTRWSNHEVLAHLVLGYRVALAPLMWGMVRHRGSFDAANAELAEAAAHRHGPAELIDEFARLMDRPRAVGRIFPKRLLLGDHVIHELDIAFGLGREPHVEAAALVAVLNTQVRIPNPFVPAAAIARGLHLIATDVDWAHGDGPLTVTGGAAQLASVLAGRPWALDRLAGDGIDELRARL
ncbi:maleylpyruvate isomerase family mycothiol-dependent enzyme [Mycobacterium kubicae]|uniref:maleylpyruvate isomerase family mycothiol-dependent enzyme n=1 Tax=Mycobacterium kubicae TaxID=120959 RepID=UPI00163F15E0|nr:maleylpyruvate isomerase family mycothiol-dependent enzyme [Mycobacterium kubicae]QNI07722.1 maleylpyruvate isomerase family mycothiol-dependent enzyme [Mycobacterium kubicae]